MSLHDPIGVAGPMDQEGVRMLSERVTPDGRPGWSKSRAVVLLMCVLTLGACATARRATRSVSMSVPGYEGVVDAYEPSEGTRTRSIAVITLHGKGGGRSRDEYVFVASELSKAGYAVYAPDMPWKDYSATLDTAFAFLDRVVSGASSGGKRVVVIGHSQGAAMALIYVSHKRPPAAVIGAVAQAPGHMIHLAGPFQKATADSVVEARKLIEGGQGRNKASFEDFNQGSSFRIRTTPEIYRSYFDTRVHPDVARTLGNLYVPLLWLDGDSDWTAVAHGYEALYRRARAYPQNRYQKVPGKHVGMVRNTPEVIIEWLQQFE